MGARQASYVLTCYACEKREEYYFDALPTYAQVWGTKAGPYEFKPAPKSNYDDMFSPLNFSAPLSLEKMERSYAIDDQQMSIVNTFCCQRTP